MNKSKLERVTLFENKVGVDLPDGICDMSIRRIAQLYPMKEKPQVVKVYGHEECWFSFRLSSNRLNDESVFEMLSTFQLHFQQMYPSMLEEKITRIGEESNIRMYFSICSSGLTAKTYQMMYILPIKGRLLFATACCDVNRQMEWEELFKKVILSVTDLTST